MEQQFKKEHGVVYTSDNIIQYILNRTIYEIRDNIKICDISCGTGNFLTAAANRIHTAFKKTYWQTYEENIWGMDLDEDAIRSLESTFNQEIIKETGYPGLTNLFCGNSTDKKFVEPYFGSFDAVVGNPPFVRLQNVQEEDRKF